MLRSVADGLDCTLVNKFFSELQCYLSTTATRGQSLLAIVARGKQEQIYRRGLQYAIYVAAVGRWPLVEVPL